jgi:hypothetical protein
MVLILGVARQAVNQERQQHPQQQPPAHGVHVIPAEGEDKADYAKSFARNDARY